MNFQGTWVWVTGASSGLGRELARKLAFEHKANLIISARRADRLEALKVELETAAGVQVRVVVTDLANMDHVERAIAEVKAIAPLSAVILNAAVTHFGHHSELGWPAFQSMVNTNVVSAARITTEFAAHAHEQKVPLSIMLVTSLQGFIPIPYFAAYSGTKGFVTNFGLALGHELRRGGSGVRVQVFTPSGIATEQTSGERFASLQSFLMSPEVVAAKVVAALHSGRVLTSAMGFWERVGLVFERFAPREVAIRFMGALYKRSMDQATAKAALAGGNAPAAK